MPDISLDMDQPIVLGDKGSAYFEDVIHRIIASINLVLVEVTANYSQTNEDDIIFCTGSLTVTLLPPTDITKTITIRCISGTTTITASSGTTEVSSLAAGASTTLAAISTGWFTV